MEKIALITDSACDLTTEEIKKHNIHLLPLIIHYSTGDFRDKIDITAEEIYNSLDKEIPKTSLPSVEHTNSLLESLENDGYTHVIVITLSSGLSGTYNSIRLTLEDHSNLKSFIFDTKILAYPEGLTVLETAKLIEAGKSFDEITSEIPKIKEKISGYFTINTLEYLKKGGRIGRVSGTLGEMLNLKPVITCDENGVYYTVSKARGRKQSISKLIEILKEHLATNKCNVWVLEGGAKEEAIKFRDSLVGMNNILNIGISEISPALGIHAGPGLLGLAIQKVD